MKSAMLHPPSWWIKAFEQDPDEALSSFEETIEAQWEAWEAWSQEDQEQLIEQCFVNPKRWDSLGMLARREVNKKSTVVSYSLHMITTGPWLEACVKAPIDVQQEWGMFHPLSDLIKSVALDSPGQAGRVLWAHRQSPVIQTLAAKVLESTLVARDVTSTFPAAFQVIQKRLKDLVQEGRLQETPLWASALKKAFFSTKQPNLNHVFEAIPDSVRSDVLRNIIHTQWAIGDLIELLETPESQQILETLVSANPPTSWPIPPHDKNKPSQQEMFLLALALFIFATPDHPHQHAAAQFVMDLTNRHPTEEENRWKWMVPAGHYFEERIKTVLAQTQAILTSHALNTTIAALPLDKSTPKRALM